jgi:predicted acetyltransferase
VNESALTFRTATESDLDRLVEIHTSAFPDPRGHSERRRNFIANPLGPLDALWVAVDHGEIVAHAFLFSLRKWLAGAAVDVAAIASVGVAPEARGRGVAASLLQHLHAKGDAQKASVTMLYAFRQGFYARHGYAPVTPSRLLRIHPASIPSAWREERGIALRGARKGDRVAIVDAYTRAARLSHGWLARPEALWDRAFADERRVWTLAARGKKVVGYAAWSLVQSQAHAETRMRVHDVATDDDQARRALFGAIGAQRDQVTEIEVEVDARDPLDRALLDADRARFGTQTIEHAIGEVSAGPMVRLVDVARAISARRYPTDGSIDVVVDDRPALRVTVAKGRAKTSIAERPRAPLTLSRAAARPRRWRAPTLSSRPLRSSPSIRTDAWRAATRAISASGKCSRSPPKTRPSSRSLCAPEASSAPARSPPCWRRLPRRSGWRRSRKALR